MSICILQIKPYKTLPHSQNLARSRVVTWSRNIWSSKECQREDSEDMTAEQCGGFCNDFCPVFHLTAILVENKCMYMWPCHQSCVGLCSIYVVHLWIVSHLPSTCHTSQMCVILCFSMCVSSTVYPHLDECKYIEGMKVAGEGGHIEKIRALRLANDAGANFDDTRFKTKLIDSFPESWDTICSICYNMTSLLEVILTLTLHGEQVLWTKITCSSSTDTIKALEASVLTLEAEIKTLWLGWKTPNTNKANFICKNKANCGKTRHLIEDCFQLSGGKQGQYPAW